MENFGDEYNNIWETNMFFPPEELDRIASRDSYFEDQFPALYYYSSSPDGTQSSSPGSSSKNILSERNRRKKLNERLYALRSVVPNITKMDKASIIKDAIEYIQTLHEEERRIQGEIAELESGRSSLELDQIQEEGAADVAFCSNPKRSRLMGEQQYSNNYNDYDSAGWSTSLLSSPIEVLELRVSHMGEKTVVVSLTCSKRTDTMVKLCEMFETLKLKIITASITAFSGRLTTNVFLEADEEEKDVLRLKIEAAIAALNDPDHDHDHDHDHLNK